MFGTHIDSLYDEQHMNITYSNNNSNNHLSSNTANQIGSNDINNNIGITTVIAQGLGGQTHTTTISGINVNKDPFSI
jgi:hypothetical protein